MPRPQTLVILPVAWSVMNALPWPPSSHTPFKLLAHESSSAMYRVLSRKPQFRQSVAYAQYVGRNEPCARDSDAYLWYVEC